MKQEIAQFCVGLNATVRDGLTCIDHNQRGIALVIDDQQTLVATVTDGDLRRALLNGSSLDSPVLPHIHSKFTAVSVTAGRAEVLDLMRARAIEQVPIVDAVGRIVGMHVLREIIGAVERPNWAVIMAGGRGERLRPLTDDVPKPMIRVAGKPILERIVLHLVGFGIREIYLSVNYLGPIIQKHFGDGSAFGCQIHYLRENKPLGTGGALALLPHPPRDPLVVMNGDLVTQADIGAMLETHNQGVNKLTIGAQQYSHTVPYGCLEVEGDRLVRIEEKPVLIRLVNAGIYVLAPELVGRIPKDQEFPITMLIEQCANLGEPIGAYRISEDWIDVGQSGQLRLAQHGK